MHLRSLFLLIASLFFALPWMPEASAANSPKIKYPGGKFYIWRYTLKDNNSNTGTFVGDVELNPRERRIIEDGTLFTLGATSIILRASDSEE